MKKTRPAILLTILFAALTVALAQDRPPAPMAMSHGGATLFLAQARAAKVVPPSASSATATGAFLVDPARGSVAYEITFHGLENGPPRSIALHNFGAGANGAVIYRICGDDRPCPDLASATLTGTWESGRGSATLDGKLLGEIASARVYLEIVGGNGKGEVRGQLEPNGAMVPVRNFVAHLAPAPNSGSRGTGTAVLSETHFADGRVSVLYEITVAGTSGTPKGAELVRIPAAADRSRLRFLSRNALPRLRLLPSHAAATGGTMTGEFEVDRQRRNALTVTGLQADNTETGILVSTSRFPEGELFGVFKPVH
jgi:hypothetical protein